MNKVQALVRHFLRGFGIEIENDAPPPLRSIRRVADTSAISALFGADADRLDQYARDLEAIARAGKTWDGRTLDDIEREQRAKYPQGRRGVIFG
jgi:hypothetical protein